MIIANVNHLFLPDHPALATVTLEIPGSRGQRQLNYNLFQWSTQQHILEYESIEVQSSSPCYLPVSNLPKLLGPGGVDFLFTHHSRDGCPVLQIGVVISSLSSLVQSPSLTHNTNQTTAKSYSSMSHHPHLSETLGPNTTLVQSSTFSSIEKRLTALAPAISSVDGARGKTTVLLLVLWDVETASGADRILTKLDFLAIDTNVKLVLVWSAVEAWAVLESITDESNYYTYNSSLIGGKIKCSFPPPQLSAALSSNTGLNSSSTSTLSSYFRESVINALSMSMPKDYCTQRDAGRLVNEASTLRRLFLETDLEAMACDGARRKKKSTTEHFNDTSTPVIATTTIPEFTCKKAAKMSSVIHSQFPSTSLSLEQELATIMPLHAEDNYTPLPISFPCLSKNVPITDSSVNRHDILLHREEDGGDPGKISPVEVSRLGTYNVGCLAVSATKGTLDSDGARFRIQSDVTREALRKQQELEFDDSD